MFADIPVSKMKAVEHNVWKTFAGEEYRFGNRSNVFGVFIINDKLLLNNFDKVKAFMFRQIKK